MCGAGLSCACAPFAFCSGGYRCRRAGIVTSSLDPATHSVSASLSHFSAFQLGDGASPSAEFLPSLQGFQTSLYTGAASYTYPFALPSGPGGLKPTLTLSYSSASMDGSSGLRLKQQAGWVGQGWSLDTPRLPPPKCPTASSTTT